MSANRVSIERQKESATQAAVTGAMYGAIGIFFFVHAYNYLIRHIMNFIIQKSNSEFIGGFLRAITSILEMFAERSVTFHVIAKGALVGAFVALLVHQFSKSMHR